MVVSAFRRFVVIPMVLAVTAIVALTASTDTAEARKRRGGGYSPPYASIVVDVNTGKVLQGTNPDAPRFPASVTKVMTLYMLFEQLERGKFKLDTPLSVSAFAARQAPSKIGFDPGETIEVEDAIKALVTKSANDVAVVVAEAIGGDQDTFGEMMTRKARSLGMSRTTLRNAIWRPLAAPFMSASPSTGAISRPPAFNMPDAPIATTTSFWAVWKAWMASRPATPVPRASTC
jgi:D-alanyl-D-alanine carboxypeptidase